MDRFFIAADAVQGNTATITGEDVAHITRVLRLGEGDCICLCDGQGIEYTARISAVEKQAVQAELLEKRSCESEAAHRIILYQALPKAGKLETIIQKCVELGVAEIRPIYTARCVVRPDGFEKKLPRYSRVAYEAAKQSRRGVIPAVRPVQALEQCGFRAHGLTLLAYEEARERSLKQALQANPVQEIALVIGPEGGFAPGEAAYLQNMGACAVGLGKRILRTETAGMAMLAMVLYELEG